MSRTVRAKMRCNHVAKTGDPRYPTVSVQLGAVYSNDPESENRAFARATPSGSVTLNIDPAKPAAEMFELGMEYYVDITLAEKPEWGFLRDGNLPPDGGSVIVAKRGGVDPLPAQIENVNGSGRYKIRCLLDGEEIYEDVYSDASVLQAAGYQFWKMASEP